MQMNAITYATQKPVPKSVQGQERKREMRRRFKERHSTACADLSRTYVKNMKVIGQKTNMRMCVHLLRV